MGKISIKCILKTNKQTFIIWCIFEMFLYWSRLLKNITFHILNDRYHEQNDFIVTYMHIYINRIALRLILFPSVFEVNFAEHFFFLFFGHFMVVNALDIITIELQNKSLNI